MKIITLDDPATIRRDSKNTPKPNGHEDVIETEKGQGGLVRIRAEGPEFVLTGRSTPATTGPGMVRAIGAGARRSIVKPFESDALHAKTQQVPGA